AFVIDVGPVRCSTSAACTPRVAAAAASSAAARVAAAEDRPPRPTIRRRAITIAMNRGQDPLAGTEAAGALLAGELAVALVARVAAVGRIADPFVDVDVAAAAAAAQAIAHPRKEALAEDAAARTRPAVVAARLAAVGAALVIAPIPNDWPGEA